MEGRECFQYEIKSFTETLRSIAAFRSASSMLGQNLQKINESQLVEISGIGNLLFLFCVKRHRDVVHNTDVDVLLSFIYDFNNCI